MALAGHTERNGLLKFLCRTLCLLGMLIAFSKEVVAWEGMLVPSLALRGEYDDNVLFSRAFEEGDYVLTVTPGLSADYRTERGNVNATAAIDVLRYAQNESLDTTNQRYGLGGGFSLSELLQARGNVSYVNDTTLDSQLEETGIVSLRQKRESFGTGAGLTYRVSGLTDIGADASYRRVEYGGPSLDYDDYSLTFQLNRLLANGKSTFTVQPYYDHYGSDASEVDNYGLSLGLAHAFTETLSLRAFLGVRYTETAYRLIQQDRAVVFDPSLLPFFAFREVVLFREVSVTDSNWNGVADISVRKRGVLYEFSVGYVHDLSYSSSGDPLELYRLYGTYTRSITARLGFGLSASVYQSKSEGRFAQTDTKYFNSSLSLNYKLTENHFLQAGYRYAIEQDDTLETDNRADRNIVWVSVGLVFPKKW